jgi:hypothetical protein
VIQSLKLGQEVYDAAGKLASTEFKTLVASGKTPSKQCKTFKHPAPECFNHMGANWKSISKYIRLLGRRLGDANAKPAKPERQDMLVDGQTSERTGTKGAALTLPNTCVVGAFALFEKSSGNVLNIGFYYKPVDPARNKLKKAQVTAPTGGSAGPAAPVAVVAVAPAAAAGGVKGAVLNAGAKA